MFGSGKPTAAQARLENWRIAVLCEVFLAEFGKGGVGKRGSGKVGKGD